MVFWDLSIPVGNPIYFLDIHGRVSIEFIIDGSLKGYKISTLDYKEIKSGVILKSFCLQGMENNKAFFSST